MDPRVKTTPADWQKAFELQSELASQISHGTKAVRRARSVTEQIDEIAKQPGAPASELASLKTKIQALLETAKPTSADEPPPSLAGPTAEAAELYGQLDRADAAPTKAQVAAADNLAEESKEGFKVWGKIVAKDVEALNKQLKAASLPELNPNSAPNQPGQTDEAEDDDEG